MLVRTEGELDPRSRMVHLVARVTDPYGLEDNAEAERTTPLAVGLFVKAEIEGLSVEPEKAAENKPDDTYMGGNTMMFMASNIASGRLDKGDATRRLSDLLIGQKTVLVKQLRRNLQIQAFMDIWLYFHVPLSFALLAALTAHIVSVFFYW